MESPNNVANPIRDTIKKEPQDEDAAPCENEFAEEAKEELAVRYKQEEKENQQPSLSQVANDCQRENSAKKRIRLDPAQFLADRRKDNERGKIFVLQQAVGSTRDGPPTFLCIDSRIEQVGGLKRKIPRPANAFMLFANEWRKKLAAENPRESNKDISVRLGNLWKTMTKDVKEKYFAMAREVDAEHKRKYPDYVYNPKEARLRKAMREQSRELTRRSILQNAIGRNAALPSPSPSPSPSTAFLEHHHQHHRFGCNAGVSGVSGTAVNGGGGAGSNSSSLPMQSAERIPDGWFANTGKPPPVHSMGRLNDWYAQNNGTDPIERLQAMGTMHQQQRVLEKCKSQAAAAATAVSAFSAPEYSPFNGITRDRDIRRTDGLQEYSDFADGQKWHPYQNGGNSHQHPRTPHPSQMSSILHPSVQNTSHGHHGHALWGQFCHATQPHVPTMPRNVGIRGPRHAVFLRDHPVNRHCVFPEEVSRLPYASSKLEVDAVRTSYPPTEHQMPRMMESSVAPVVESPSVTKNRRDEQEEPARWDSNAVSSNMSLDGLVPTSTSQQQDSSASREKPQEVRRPMDRFEPKKKTVSKQPLPGFHQAFGSTEIGRFSRSEYFVSMVGESNSVETESNDVSREHRLEMTNSTAATTAADSTTVSTGGVTRNGATSRSFESEESEEASSFDESQSELVCPSASYCGQPSTPRWHSPHVGPIGSEI